AGEPPAPCRAAAGCGLPVARPADRRDRGGRRRLSVKLRYARGGKVGKVRRRCHRRRRGEPGAVARKKPRRQTWLEGRETPGLQTSYTLDHLARNPGKTPRSSQVSRRGKNRRWRYPSGRFPPG